MDSALVMIPAMLIMCAASLNVMFDLVAAYPFEHNLQVWRRRQTNWHTSGSWDD